jgi:EpsI family protein
MSLKSVKLGSLAIGMAMLGAAGLAVALTPTRAIPKSEVPSLEKAVPTQFGAWREVQTGLIQMNLTPRQDAEGNDIASLTYDQILMRTYHRSDGATVMLALAYGEEQRQEIKIHRPELCYVSQGFQVRAVPGSNFTYRGSNEIATTHLIARNGQREEPITYWIRIGDRFVRNAWETRGTIFAAGLNRKVLDGILVRVSSIEAHGSDPSNAYAIQEQFLTDLIDALDSPGRRMLLGGQSQAIKPPS